VVILKFSFHRWDGEIILLVVECNDMGNNDKWIALNGYQKGGGKK
jgi:hypothetical protein